MVIRKSVDIDALCGQWIHSREEDTKEEIVYRPVGYPLPPSRGRSGIELRADKTYRRSDIGPTDTSAVRDGQWLLEDGDEVRIRVESDGKQETLTVASLDNDRLVVRRKTARG